MSSLILSTERPSEFSTDFVGPPARLNMDSDAASPVSSQAELQITNLSQPDCSDSKVSNFGNESSRIHSTISELIRKFGSVSSIVRVVGVAAMVLAMGLFLLDGMGVVNDTQRFFTMLTLSGLLSAGGFSLAFILKEQRGARSFFGLALLSVPANFAVLGALFYSVFQFDAVSTAYPTVAHWKIANIASLGSAALVAAVVLIPITLIGVSIMGREGRAWLSGALLVSSSMLLLPIRDTSLIAPIVATIIFALISLIKYRGEGITSLKTSAGRFVQALLFLPPAIMLFRSFWLYDVSSLSAFVIALTMYAVLRYTSMRVSSDGVICNTLHVGGALVALLAASLSIEIFTGLVGKSNQALIFITIFGGLMFDLERQIKNTQFSRILGIGTSLVLSIIILVHQQIHDGITVFATGLCIPIVLTGVGVVRNHNHKMLIGGLTLAAVLLLNAGGVIHLIADAGWLGFASLGACAILVASLLERFGAMFSMRVRKIVLNGREDTRTH